MNGTSEIHGFAERKDYEAFLLDAGGGGGILVYGPDPEAVQALRG